MKRAAAAALFLFRFRPRVTGHVGALHPASPCSTVGPRQPRRLFPGARPSMLASPSPQALVSSSGHANPGAFFPARGLPCWRRASRKPLFLHRTAPTPTPRSDSVRARQPAKPMNSVYEREPWNGKRRKSSPRSGLVRAHLPAKPMNSVYEREPWNGKRRKSSSRSDSVRARLSAKPMNSVYEREPWNGKRRKSSPRSGSVRARQPAKPMNSVFEREPPAMLASPSINSVFHRRATPTSAPFPDLQPNCVKQKTQEFPSTSLNE